MPQARPRIVERVFNEVCTDGVLKDVPRDREEVSIALDRESAEAILPDMAAAFVIETVAGSMSRHPGVHKPAQGVDVL